MLVEATSDPQTPQVEAIPDDAMLTPPAPDTAAYRRLEYRLDSIKDRFALTALIERRILVRLLRDEPPVFGDSRSVVIGPYSKRPLDHPARLEAIEMASTIWRSVADLLNPPMNED